MEANETSSLKEQMKRTWNVQRARMEGLKNDLWHEHVTLARPVRYLWWNLLRYVAFCITGLHPAQWPLKLFIAWEDLDRPRGVAVDQSDSRVTVDDSRCGVVIIDIAVRFTHPVSLPEWALTHFFSLSPMRSELQWRKTLYIIKIIPLKNLCACEQECNAFTESDYFLIIQILRINFFLLHNQSSKHFTVLTRKQWRGH